MSQQPDESARLDEFVQRQVSDALRRRRAQQDWESSTRAEHLASDVDRDVAASVLNQAFAEGRLTFEEHAERTTRAFTARTHGELDEVLRGLHVPTAPAPGRSLRKVLFWIVTIVTSPFLLAGCGLTMAGSEADDRVYGIVLLLLFAPGLFALHRWAWPKDRATRWSRVAGER